MERGLRLAQGGLLLVFLVASCWQWATPVGAQDTSEPAAVPETGLRPETGAAGISSGDPAATPGIRPAPFRTVGELYGSQGDGRDGATGAPGTAPSGERTSTGSVSITIGDYLRVLGWLLVVVVLSIFCIYVLKRIQRGTARLGGNRLVEVVGRTAVGPKQHVLLVRVAQRVLVVGMAPEGLSPLAEITDPAEVLQLTRGEGFREHLQALEADPDEDRAASAARSPELAPYQREIRQLKDMIGNWRRGPRRSEVAP